VPDHRSSGDSTPPQVIPTHSAAARREHCSGRGRPSDAGAARARARSRAPPRDPGPVAAGPRRSKSFGLMRTAPYPAHNEAPEVVGAATITATCVTTHQDAVDLVRHFNRLGMAGVDLAQALAEARTQTHREYPALREVLPAFLAEQVKLLNLRESTARAYKNRLKTWAYPRFGDIPWNLLTREEIGAVLLEIRRAGKSSASVEQIRCPLTKFYAWQINVHSYRSQTRPRTSSPSSAGSRASDRASAISSGSRRRRLRLSLRPAASSSRAGMRHGRLGRGSPLGRDHGAPEVRHRLGKAAGPRSADVVRGWRPDRAVQGR